MADYGINGKAWKGNGPESYSWVTRVEMKGSGVQATEYTTSGAKVGLSEIRSDDVTGTAINRPSLQ